MSEFSHAYDLICIVDQIHEYAVKQHRDFVIKHLKAWHRRHEDVMEERYKKEEAGEIKIYDLIFEEYTFGIPEWKRVKDVLSKETADKKSETKRAAKLNKLPVPAEGTLRRKRGRPRLDESAATKTSTGGKEQGEQSLVPEFSLKRKRGRPRVDQSAAVKSPQRGKNTATGSTMGDHSKNSLLSSVRKYAYSPQNN